MATVLSLSLEKELFAPSTERKRCVSSAHSVTVLVCVSLCPLATSTGAKASMTSIRLKYVAIGDFKILKTAQRSIVCVTCTAFQCVCDIVCVRAWAWAWACARARAHHTHLPVQLVQFAPRKLVDDRSAAKETSDTDPNVGSRHNIRYRFLPRSP